MSPHSVSSRGRVLLVDDEPHVLTLLAAGLRAHFKVETANHAKQALERLRRAEFLAVLTDFDMPGPNGAWLLEQVAAQFPRVRRLMMTARASLAGEAPEHLQGKIKDGLIEVFFAKPVILDELVEAITGRG